MTDFLKIATSFVQLGIPVFPLMPNTKVPPAGLHWDKEATTDLNKVAAWALANNNYNVGLAALPGGEFCFLEFDVKSGMREVVRDMRQEDIPATRIQKSGKGFAHYIFRHTKRSRKLGNRSVNQPDGHEWFSFRADNKYLVGAGSIHPNGTTYKTLLDVDPIAIPDWVCDWIELNSQPVKKGGCDNTSDVDADFDFDDFCDFYGISGIQQGDWFITDECPVAGYRHQGSTRTGFFYDGKSLGFHCFAQGCEGSQMSVGKVIGYLNAQKGKPYKGIIWGKQEDDVDGFEVEIPDDDIFEPEPNAPQVVTDADALMAMMNEEPVTVETRPAANLEEALRYRDNHGRVPVTNDEEQEQPEEEKPLVDPNLKYLAWLDVGAGNGLGLLTKNAATYDMEELEWLWPQRIPKKKITLFTGKPDCGKSVAMLDLISRVTTGADFPDGEKNTLGPSKVLLAASEDDPTDTLIPRLVAAGADIPKVELVVGTIVKTKDKNPRRTNLNLKRDAKMLLDAIKKNPDVQLLCLDPITGFFGDADTNKDKEIRPILEEISRMCNKSGITVVGIIHSNKRSDVDAVHKVSGAGAMAAVVRAVWGFSRDSEDKSKYHMAFVKGNLGKVKSGITYAIDEFMVDIKGKMVGQPKITWGEKIDEDADDLLKAERNNKDAKDTKSIMATVLIKSMLPCKAKDIFKKAEDEGIPVVTVKRAKYQMSDIISQKRGNEWWWFTKDNSPQMMSQAFKDAEAAVTQEITMAHT